MLRFAPWKLASVLALVAAAVLLVVPSFLPSGPSTRWRRALPGFIPLRQIVLGLDLQGGAYMLMQVDEASVIKTQVEALRDDVRQKLRDGKIALSRRHRHPAARRSRAHRRPGRARQGATVCCSRSASRSAAPLAGGNGRTLDVSETDSGRAAHADRRRDRRQGAPRRDAVDRGAQPPHQRDGHQGDRNRSSRARAAC